MSHFTLLTSFVPTHSNDGDDILVGGGASLDYIYGGENDDLAAGDCVYIQFNNGNNLVESITSISESSGKPDELHGENGNDILGEFNQRVC